MLPNKFSLVIVSSGKGLRFTDGNVPKQFLKNNVFVEPLIQAILSFSSFQWNEIVVLVPKEYVLYTKNITDKLHLKNKLLVSAGLDKRYKTVQKGVSLLQETEFVAIHDAVRPFVERRIIKALREEMANNKYSCIAPYMEIPDSVQVLLSGKYHSIDRKIVMRVATPQFFILKDLKSVLYKTRQKNFYDELSLMQDYSFSIHLIQGNNSMEKITYSGDEKRLMLNNSTHCSGFGFDCHKVQYQSKSTLYLCGLAIPCNYKTIAHSDGDCALHALCDALLGISASGDLGEHFPSNQENMKRSSGDFLSKVMYITRKKNIMPFGIDITIIFERVKLGQYRNQMIDSLYELTQVPKKNISVKFKTADKIGVIGDGNGIACFALVNSYKAMNIDIL